MSEPYDASLYHVLDKVVPDINMFGLIVEHRILRKTNPTLVIAKDNDGIYHMPKQLTEELSQSNNFTTGHTRYNVFGLSGAQSHRLLLLAHQNPR